jgi:hypothetical protein
VHHYSPSQKVMGSTKMLQSSPLLAAFTALGESQKSESTSREAGSRRGLGSLGIGANLKERGRRFKAAS